MQTKSILTMENKLDKEDIAQLAKIFDLLAKYDSEDKNKDNVGKS